MEVKILISDGGSTPGTIEVSGQASGMSTRTPMATAGPISSADVTDAGQAGGGVAGVTSIADTSAAAPPDLLLRAAELGAMNAGSAPDLSVFQQGAPPPFITGQLEPMHLGPELVSAVPESAGPAPGSGAIMVTYTAPEGTGGQHD